MLPHGCPKWADTKDTSLMSKMRGGGSGPLLDNVQKKDAFFMVPLRTIIGKHINRYYYSKFIQNSTTSKLILSQIIEIHGKLSNPIKNSPKFNEF